MKVITSSAVPSGVALVLPSGPVPTRDTSADECERWARGIALLTGLADTSRA